jgi:acyl-coenzyme A thioesterase PaaI-like protein
VATTTLRAAHEGPPGRSHGGVIAAIFDDVFGFILQIEETAAFTGELAVRYELGVPLHRLITFRVRMNDRIGRKLFMTGGCWDGDLRLATATATFIAPAAAISPDANC